MIKDGNVRIAITLTEKEYSDLVKICSLYGWSKSQVVKMGLFLFIKENTNI